MRQLAGEGFTALLSRVPPPSVDQRRGDTSSAAAGATLAMKAEGSGEMADAAVVLTDSGPVRGTVTDDYRLFRGNPVCSIDGGCASLAASATGAPMDPGKRCHQAGGPMCPQQPSTYAKVASLAEDCLCLNVISPRAADPQQPRPVMVWIDGDGAIGAGSFFDARRLATIEDVVVVTINYRLGIFGAFGYPGLEGPGAYGLQDQQSALRWVARNAAAVGG